MHIVPYESIIVLFGMAWLDIVISDQVALKFWIADGNYRTKYHGIIFLTPFSKPQI